MAVSRQSLLSPLEVSEGWGIPERTLTQWRYLGKGPKWIKVGRHVRYRLSDLESWLDEQTRDPADA